MHNERKPRFNLTYEKFRFDGDFFVRNLDASVEILYLYRIKVGLRVVWNGVISSCEGHLGFPQRQIHSAPSPALETSSKFSSSL